MDNKPLVWVKAIHAKTKKVGRMKPIKPFDFTAFEAEETLLKIKAKQSTREATTYTALNKETTPILRPFTAPVFSMPGSKADAGAVIVSAADASAAPQLTPSPLHPVQPPQHQRLTPPDQSFKHHHGSLHKWRRHIKEPRIYEEDYSKVDPHRLRPAGTTQRAKMLGGVGEAEGHYNIVNNAFHTKERHDWFLGGMVETASPHSSHHGDNVVIAGTAAATTAANATNANEKENKQELAKDETFAASDAAIAVKATKKKKKKTKKTWAAVARPSTVGGPFTADALPSIMESSISILPAPLALEPLRKTPPLRPIITPILSEVSASIQTERVERPGTVKEPYWSDHLQEEMSDAKVSVANLEEQLAIMTLESRENTLLGYEMRLGKRKPAANAANLNNNAISAAYLRSYDRFNAMPTFWQINRKPEKKQVLEGELRGTQKTLPLPPPHIKDVYDLPVEERERCLRYAPYRQKVSNI